MQLCMYHRGFLESQGKVQFCYGNATRLGLPIKNWNRNTKSVKEMQKSEAKVQSIFCRKLHLEHSYQLQKSNITAPT